MLRRTCALATVTFALSLFSATAAATTAQRTFVASTGNDANPCSIAQPCRGFARAMTQTSAGGEVIVLDSAGYGKLTITQAVSINAPPGVYAGISVFSGDDGITVNAAAGDKVTLRGLLVNGQGGSNGIVFTGGAELEIDRCIVSGMLVDGIDIGAAAGMTTIADTVVERNGGVGIRFTNRLSGISTGVLTSVRVSNNSSVGLIIDVGYQVQVRTSVFHQNNSGGVLAQAVVNGGTIVLDMTGSLVSGNGDYGVVLEILNVTTFVQAVLSDNVITDHRTAGIYANGQVGAAGGVHAVLIRNVVRGYGTADGILVSNPNAEALLQGNVVSQTATGVVVQNSAIVRSRGDNVVDDNSTNKSGTVGAVNSL